MTLEELDSFISCDQCGSARAKYLLKLVYGELAFCKHHFEKNRPSLDKQAYEIIELEKKEELPKERITSGR